MTWSETFAWHDGRMVAADTETTGVGADARIVTACVMLPGEQPQTWLLDPGIPIPDDAAKVHGVTTEKAQADGMDYRAGLRQIADAIDLATHGRALVGFNVSFDLTVLARECERVGVGFTVPEWIVDPYVLDRAIDQYRKGSRQLAATAQVYGVDLVDAHTADADARAAGRIAQVMARRAAEQRHGDPFGALHGLTFEQLHAWQAAQHRKRQDSFRAYRQGRGESWEDIDSGWPLRELLPPVVREAVPS
ncbi:exonuclease domain-containing protein [Tsukamurella pseudospumae]|uniref:Exonuclease domain-containing protein n=1 Tax=Tsukamurella pseudospumae TaxID=239498 RepID=A0A137ZRS8_9ACTN|nr:exonuclease domain-containing protein [Tsukamurella pseudospumae]KXP00859.1 hypothetical protein AXK61_12685 [Tsukamurella pseudospumae]